MDRSPLPIASDRIRALPAKDCDFQRRRHVRFFKPGIVYHVLFKTLQGFFLLTPDLEHELRELIAGVLARAQRNWPEVATYAAVWLSNHGHLMLAGDPGNLVAFIAFLKREISRRWGPKIGWSGPMWGRYETTALVTPEAQQRCFEYVLGQAVKEDLVTTPQDWPGFHCAQVL